MPIIKSAKKRVRVAKKAAVRNSKTKRNLKTAVKALHSAISGGKDTKKATSKAQSAIDTAVKKGVIHKNKAARKKAQLAKAAKKATGSRPSSEIASKSGISPYVVSKAQNIARRMGLNRVNDFLRLLKEIEITSKKQTYDLDDALKYAIFKLSI